MVWGENMPEIDEVLARVCEKTIKLLPDDGSISLLEDMVTFFKQSQDGNYPFADCYEPSIIYVINGQCEYLIGDQSIKLTQGQCLICAIKVPIAFNSIGASEEHPFLAIKIDIKPKTILSIMKQANHIIDEHSYRKENDLPNACESSQSSYFDLYTLDLLAELMLNDCQEDFPYQTVILQLYYYWLQNTTIAPLVSHYIIKNNLYMVKAVAYLDKHYEKNIAISKLASMCSMSESNFYKCFKKATSMSPLQYLKRKRLIESRFFITQRGYKAKEAARLVGYSSESQFSRDYAKFFGLPPKKDAQVYRLEHPTYEDVDELDPLP